MLEVAVIGAGVCGLALARRLQTLGVSWALYEARPRLGGRVLSVPTGESFRVDLGATWYWPDSEPRMTALVRDLGLPDFPQRDEGSVLVLRDADKRPEEATGQSVHQGARRLAGGTASLVEALAASLPAGRVHLGHVLTQVTRRDGYLELRLTRGPEILTVSARHVVLALPPRLVPEQIRFEPALDGPVIEALEAVPTWMATRAKAVLTYAKPQWRADGRAGNAFVQHEQATLSEIFDACDAEGRQAALGGFLALTPEARKRFRHGLPMLLSNQMTQLFGTALIETAQLYQDWAEEPLTCSARDLAQEAQQPGPAAAQLREAHWEGQLFFGSSETASHGAGHMEGALDAAQRIGDLLATSARITGDAEASQAVASTGNVTAPQSPRSPNAVCVARFRSWVASQQRTAFDGYRRRINQSLAVQQSDQLTQRAMLGAMEELFGEALTQLQDLPFDTRDVPVERNRSALTPEVQAAFQGFLQALLDDVTAFNRASCALSNFPDEHELPGDYVQTILRDIAAAWKEFSIEANGILLDKGLPPPPPSASVLAFPSGGRG